MTEPHDDLPALDPPAAALLAAYRRERAMPPAARARVRDKLSGTCPEVHVLADRRWQRAARAWAVGLAIAAALLLWFGRRGPDLAEQTGPSATMSPAHGAAGSASAAASVGAAPSDASAGDGGASEPVPASEPELEVIDRPEPPPPARGDGKSKRDADMKSRSADQPRDGDPEPPAASSLRDEQELLARGWQALADGHAELAARDAAEHARRFPAGILTPERRALEAAAACSESPESGADLARAFLADHPRSPLARRVRDACERTQ